MEKIRFLSASSPLRPRGPTLLVIGVLAGLASPPLSEAARPLLSPTIFIFVLGTFLRVDGRQFLAALRRPVISVALPLIALFACPLLMVAATHVVGLGAELSLAMVLSVAAPPSSGRRPLPACSAWMRRSRLPSRCCRWR